MTADARETLIATLVRTSFKVADEPIFKLASGGVSNYYVDCKMALSHPEARDAIGALVLAMLGEEGLAGVDAVGGMELGAYPIAIAVSDAAWRRGGVSLPVFVVRKEPKGHGTKKYVEGDVRAGMKVLMVEDVLTTGGSTARAIDRCREAGLEPVRAIALVDRREDRSEPLMGAGMHLEALLSLEDLRAAAASAN